MGRLTNKVAVITGGASGIGKEQALKFASEGAKVVVADLNEKGIEETVAQIKGKGGDAIAVKVDITSDADLQNLVEQAIKEFGKISILCNTAGIFDQYRPLLETSESQWDKIVSINITAIYKITSKVLPYMLKEKYGVIINMTSGAGLIGGGGGIGYTSTKHAVVGFTKQLNADYGQQGIRANAIAPGLIQTPMVQQIIADPNAGINETLSKLPAGRYGQPEEIADLSLFLASDESKYIYGAIVPIDGGLLSTLR